LRVWTHSVYDHTRLMKQSASSSRSRNCSVYVLSQK